MKKIVNKVAQAYDRFLKAVNEWTREGIDYIDRQMKRSMELPKSGKFNPNTGKPRSAPGESPAPDTRELTNSLSRDYQFLKAVEFTRDPKAIYLEDGTSRMAARPLWEKTLLEESPFLKDSLNQKIKEAQNDN